MRACSCRCRKLQRGFTFAGKIDELWRARLHAIRHFVSGDARRDFLVPGFDEALEIQITNGVDGSALLFRIHAFRTRDIQNWIAPDCAAARPGKPSAKNRSPNSRAAAWPARAALQHNEPGKSLDSLPIP
jgi:hypothetical protein